MPFDRARGRRRGTDVADTRMHIVGSACQEFVDHGYVAGRMSRSASGIGLSRSAVKYHLPDKLELYREVVERTDAWFAAVLGSTKAHQDSPRCLPSWWPCSPPSCSTPAMPVVD